MRFATLSVAAALALSATALTAHAAGSDTSSSTPTCKKGYVYSSAKKKCVRKTSSVIPQDSIKSQGWALAREGRYEDAIAMFRLAANQNDPEVLNGLGFSHRKLGKVEQGVAFYAKALEANPDYILAREYLGEGYVVLGKLNLAKVQLDEIGNRCGTACEEYMLLARAIDTGKPNY